MANSLHRLVKIQADAQGNLPSSIELLRTGEWTTPWHGDFEITTADLHQYVANANAGVGLVAADPKIPLNYGHDAGNKAAGWIDPQAGGIYVSADGQALMGNPQWTPAAQQAIKAGEWRYISPEFNPRELPWEDPEELRSFVDNVVTGAALTNIPLFKKLKPVQASRVTGSSDKPKQPKGEDMDLATVRAKEVKDLTDEEKAFLAEHKAELTDDERKTFGLEEVEDDAAAKAQAEAEAKAKEEADAKAAADKAEAEKLEASRKGTVSISADRLAKLEADAQRGVEAAAKLARNEASAFATEAIKAGRIKSEQSEKLVERLVKASKDEATFLTDFIKGLPVNEALGKENGVNASAGSGDSAIDQVFAKARDLVAASKDGLTFQDAVQNVLKADAALAKEFDKANGKKG